MHYKNTCDAIQRLCRYVPELRNYPGLKIGPTGGPDSITQWYEDLIVLRVSLFSVLGFLFHTDTRSQDDSETQSTGPHFTDFSELLASTPATGEGSSQVRYVPLDDKFLELSIRDTPPLYYNQPYVQPESSKGHREATRKVTQNASLDASVNEQEVRPFYHH